MHPLTMFLKIVAEAVRASTPQDSKANQAATKIKQGIALLDVLTADTPAKQTHALASALGEAAYANSASGKERLGVAVGNALLLALEGAQHAQSASQPTYGNAPLPPAWARACQQNPEFARELQTLLSERQDMQRRLEEQQEEERRRQQHEVEDLLRQIALLRASRA